MKNPFFMKKILYVTCSFLTLIFACTPAKPILKVDLILHNGQFFTGDAPDHSVTAIAISGDSILAVGTDEVIQQMGTPNTQIIDLQGAFAMPGFIEGHGHFLGLGESQQTLNLLYTKSWDEIVLSVAPKVKTAAKGEWIEGRGWHQEKWTTSPGATVNGYPYHDALSAISPENPVVLFHASGHGLMANANAMRLAGISKETPDPIGGRIVRDLKGNPVGVFEENAMDLITQPFSAWQNQRSEAQKQADLEHTVALAAQACLEHGITSFQDAGSSFWALKQFRRLAESGQLPIRLWAMIGQPNSSEFSKLADYPQIGLGKRHFTCRAVKAYFDGALGSYGAWLLAPYNDKPGFVGQNTTPIDSIVQLSAQCRQHELQLCVHAIGDRANREVLNIFESAFSNESTAQISAKRWRIEHAQHIDKQDISRFAAFGVIASMQAIHCTSDAPFVVKRLGEERSKTGAYAWRSLLDAGVHLANGTDTPVEEVDPLPCLYAAVTRKRVDTGLEFFPEQKMTREEALLSYTCWNAYAAFEENEKGTLAPGKLADIVVLSKNLLTCPPEEILQAKVLKTIIGGKILFEH
jgi:predicted amidohydrolase YtcJ